MKCSKKIRPATFVFAAVFTGFVSAHSQPGAIPIKKTKAGGTDIFEVRCSSNPTDGFTDHLTLRVADMFPKNPALISIQGMLWDGSKAAVSTDTKDNDGKYSSELSIAGGAGPYIMKVTKTRSRMVGRENYVISFHCVSATEDHTGTNSEMTQNE